MRFILSTFCTLFFFAPAFGQRIDLDVDFLAKLKAAGLEYLQPVEAGYKDIPVHRNPYQPFDFGIRSRKEKLEIRYLIEPYDEQDRSFRAPHVRATRLLLHLASNDQEVVMTGLDLDEKDLREEFHADWGKVFFFRPKRGFAPYENCKMLALFREGRCMAYVLFLFDEPRPELDYRFYAWQFGAELDR